MVPPSMGAGPPSGPGCPVPTTGWPLYRLCTTSPNPTNYPLTVCCQSLQWTVESAIFREWSLRAHPVTNPLSMPLGSLQTSLATADDLDHA